MATRTTEVVVRFLNAFLLPSFDKSRTAGDYPVAHDEEAIEGISKWHGVLAARSLICLPLGFKASRVKSY